MKLFFRSLCALLLVTPALAQGPSVLSAGFTAYNFAYGGNSYRIGNASGATILNPPGALKVNTGTTGAGTFTITLAFGTIKTADGLTVMPFATNAPIKIGVGANLETVTPSAVSCTTPAIYNTCQVTATFANAHGIGDPVSSGSGGLMEAVNLAGSLGGGVVIVDRAWISQGFTVAGLTAFSGYSIVSIVQNTGAASTAALSYHSTGTYPAVAAYAASAVSWY